MCVTPTLKIQSDAITIKGHNILCTKEVPKEIQIKAASR